MVLGFLVRLWNTYRVHLCRRRHSRHSRRHSRHSRRRRHRRRLEEINPIGTYESSNESSQRTE